MTAISSTGDISHPQTNIWIRPLSFMAAIGHLFTTSTAGVHTEVGPAAVVRKPRPPKRHASYYESGVAGRERFRL